jgi:hypothetical protein
VNVNEGVRIKNYEVIPFPARTDCSGLTTLYTFFTGPDILVETTHCLAFSMPNQHRQRNSGQDGYNGGWGEDKERGQVLRLS